MFAKGGQRRAGAVPTLLHSAPRASAAGPIGTDTPDQFVYDFGPDQTELRGRC
jgi:hypothetical protein